MHLHNRAKDICAMLWESSSSHRPQSLSNTLTKRPTESEWGKPDRKWTCVSRVVVVGEEEEAHKQSKKKKGFSFQRELPDSVDDNKTRFVVGRGLSKAVKAFEPTGCVFLVALGTNLSFKFLFQIFSINVCGIVQSLRKFREDFCEWKLAKFRLWKSAQKNTWKLRFFPGYF